MPLNAVAFDPARQAIEDACALAIGVLSTDKIPSETVELIKEALDEAAKSSGISIKSACDQSADAIARRLGAPGRPSHKVLTPDGWLLLDFGLIKVWHVFAVAALMVADQYQHNAPPLSGLLEVQYLAHEAQFMSGRSDMRQFVQTEEAEIRKKNASKGGQKQRFTDEELIAFRDEWCAKHGRDRGWKAAASAHFDVSDTAIQKRIAKLNI